MSKGSHKSLRSQLSPQYQEEGRYAPLPDPKDPEGAHAPRGLRDAIGRIVDLPWELEKDLEDSLPTSMENVLQDFGLAGKPILVVLAVAGIVMFAQRMSG